MKPKKVGISLEHAYAYVLSGSLNIDSAGGGSGNLRGKVYVQSVE